MKHTPLSVLSLVFSLGFAFAEEDGTYTGRYLAAGLSEENGVITGGFPPCGVCRQVMREFCEDDFVIYMVDKDGYEERTLAEILPFSFSAKKHMGA